jgi:hypothetical protein
MCRDRQDGSEIELTHDFLSLMLGVRRAGVTTAIHILEGDRAIRASRGRIEVNDREKLKAIAGTAYGVPEREYRRLLGGHDRDGRPSQTGPSPSEINDAPA